MEFSMRNSISFVALGVALAAGTSVAHAQAVETIVTPASGPAVIAQAPVVVPPSGVLLAQPAVVTAPVETVETVRTERTTTPAIVRRRVVRTRTGNRLTTTRTTTVRRVVATAPVAAAAPYDQLAEGPPLYDVVAPAVAAQPVVAAAPVIGATAPIAAGAVLPLYRYVYEPDRILVIDPATNIAIQAIPR
jgi:hypothetical protein